MLHRLEPADRPAELVTLADVHQHDLDDPLHRTDDLGRAGQGTAQVELLADLARDEGARLEVVEVELDRVAGFTREVATLLDADAIGRDVGHAPLVPVLPERHDAGWRHAPT